MPRTDVPTPIARVNARPAAARSRRLRAIAAAVGGCLAVTAALAALLPPGPARTSERRAAAAAPAVDGSHAEPPRVIDLNDPGAAARVAGAQDKDQLGNDVRGGDVNGDGIRDLVVGAHWGSDSGRNIVGRAYAVFGRSPWPAQIDLNVRALRDWSFMGVGREARMGSAVAAGDLDGDGIDDFAIGSLLADPGDRANAGAVYVMLGGADVGGHVDFLNRDPDVRLFGASGSLDSDRLGTDLAIGDFNADGRRDLAASAVFRADATGAVFVWWGPFPRGRAEDLMAGPADWSLFGHGPDAYLGASLRAGDVNGDSVDDLVVTALAASDGPADGGAVQVFLGGPDVGGVRDLATGAADVEIVGAPGEHLGAAVAAGACSCRGLVTAIGDLTGDGRPDLAVGAPLSAGRLGGVAVVAGPLSPGRYALDTLPHARVDGVAPDGRLGWSVAIGHLDDDGAPDLVASAPWADGADRVDAGAAYGWRGPLAVGGRATAADAPLVILGPERGSGGASITVLLADTDADGVDDLHLGFPDAAPFGRRSVGAIYRVAGPLLAAAPATPTAPPPAAPSPTGPAATPVISATLGTPTPTPMITATLGTPMPTHTPVIPATLGTPTGVATSDTPAPTADTATPVAPSPTAPSRTPPPSSTASATTAPSAEHTPTSTRRATTPPATGAARRAHLPLLLRPRRHR